MLWEESQRKILPAVWNTVTKERKMGVLQIERMITEIRVESQCLLLWKEDMTQTSIAFLWFIL